jgi:cell division protein ZapA
MEERSISVEIAGRAYPLSVQPHEEANVRQAASEINESIDRFKGNYPLTDKQDLLAMAALEVVTRALNSARAQELAEVSAAVGELEALLAPARPGS